jgi:hypothetical protein
MTQQRVVQVIDALIARTSALPGYRLPGSVGQFGSTTTVYDGPQFTSTDDIEPGGFLVIGWSGADSDHLEPAAESSWVSGPIAGSVHPRDETTTITCMAIAQRAESVRDARVAAFQQLSDVAAVCRADTSLGINTADVIGGVNTLCYVAAGQLIQYALNGYVAELGFSVTYQARV